MGFWRKALEVTSDILEIAPAVLSSMAEEGQKRQERVHKEYGRKINAYENKLENAERNINEMSPEQRRKIQQARENLEKSKKNMRQKGMSVDKTGVILYGDKTIDQWNSSWQTIGYLKTANLTPYNKSVGLYRHRLGEQVMYVGRAIELDNGGFRKRLSDYRRDSDSARKHKSGVIIHENLDRISTDILIIGDTKEAIEITKSLEGQFIAKFNPSWNKQINI